MYYMSYWRQHKFLRCQCKPKPKIAESENVSDLNKFRKCLETRRMTTLTFLKTFSEVPQPDKAGADTNLQTRAQTLGSVHLARQIRRNHPHNSRDLNESCWDITSASRCQIGFYYYLLLLCINSRVGFARRLDEVLRRHVRRTSF